MLPNRVFGGVLAAALLSPATHIQAQNLAVTAIVTSIQGKSLTLSVGVREGAKVGAMYAIQEKGRVVAEVQINTVGDRVSTATLTRAEPGYIVTVGDTAKFVGVRPVQPAPLDRAGLAPAPQPLVSNPSTVTPPAKAPDLMNPTGTVPAVLNPTPATVTSPAPTAPPATSTTTSAPPAPTLGQEAPTTTASVVEASAAGITINAGTAGGIRSGTNVPVLRNGNVIALLHIQSATANTASATLLWKDDAAPAITTGDKIGIFAAPATGSSPSQVVEVVNTVPSNVPATPVAYESGASNRVVPKADRTYLYLATLATSGLITRYAPDVFYDQGVRYHRTEDDITFTRSQIADLIKEAIGNAEGHDVGSRDRVALGFLTNEYRRELHQIGVNDATMEAFAARGFQLGVSGQASASFVGGTTRHVVEPFSERQGGLRMRSGIDERTNILGTVNSDLDFLLSADSGSNVSKDFNNDRRVFVRRALLSYNANKHIKGLTVEAGRDEMWAGPGHFGTLLLSDAAGPIDMLRATLKRGSYSQEGFYGSLGTGPLGGSRSLYGHNLKLAMGPQTTVGIAETLLLPKTDFDLPSFLAAFSGFPLFTAERLRHRGNGPTNGNILVEGYIETSLARGVQSYGEFLVDDIGVNQNNLVRNRLGTLLGAHFFTPRDPAKLGLYAEYANLQGRTYLGLLNISDSDYVYGNRPLGYPVMPTLGPGNGGAESLRFNLYYSPIRRLRLGGGVEFADINSENPVFSRQQTLRFKASYDLKRNLTVTARAQHVATSRPNFVPNEPSITQRLFQIDVAHAF